MEGRAYVWGSTVQSSGNAICNFPKEGDQVERTKGGLEEVEKEKRTVQCFSTPLVRVPRGEGTEAIKTEKAWKQG